MKAHASVAIALTGAALLGAGCGSTSAIEVPSSSPYYHGAVLFREHCSGCHTLSVVGAQGSATKITDRQPTNGPNFNFRKDNAEQILYAIRNGGFSGAIMPENIVVGEDAHAVANFLAQYSGRSAAPSQPTP
ncbi:MAG TPA: cytochrome c [Solirubrobacteraceae bacterium]|jgi:mono/diheme cytochrome c family protein|nr:cytochrome c [Solirubrobacteraceae bacterium]